MTLWRRRELLLGALTVAAPFAAFARSAVQDHPAPLKRGARIAALAPGTWMERGDPLLEQLRMRCQQQGWVLQTPPALDGQWRWSPVLTSYGLPPSVRPGLTLRSMRCFWWVAAGAVLGSWSRTGAFRLVRAGALASPILPRFSWLSWPRVAQVAFMAGSVAPAGNGSDSFLC